MIRQIVQIFCVSLTLAVTVIGATPAQETGSSQVTRQGRTYTQWLYDGMVDRLWPLLGPELTSHFVDRKGLRAFIAQIETEFGSETDLVAEHTLPWLGSTIYNRTARFSRVSSPIWIRWAIKPSGQVQGLLVRPVPATASSRFLDYRTKTPLHLPFEGQWFVLWGGRSIFENYHAISREQRFAYDFLIVHDGSSYSGNPASNESYYCFGKPIFAPAGGTVVAAEGEIAENMPGHKNAKLPLGNHVIVDHGNGEFSFFAHLQRGSVQVKSGMHVKAGDQLGRCGNTGNSSEPHLHYHLQTTPLFNDGEGLPAQLLNYRADGEEISRGEPTRGQTVERQ